MTYEQAREIFNNLSSPFGEQCYLDTPFTSMMLALGLKRAIHASEYNLQCALKGDDKGYQDYIQNNIRLSDWLHELADAICPAFVRRPQAEAAQAEAGGGG